MKTLFIITGASKGIGKGLAEKALADKNNTVIGISRSHSIDHNHYIPKTFDLTHVETLAHDFEKILTDFETYERIVLFNNAGSLGDVAHIGSIDNASIAALMNLNVTAPLTLMNTFMAKLKKFKGEKVIINISSGAGKSPVDGWSGYCASKAALDMATQVAFEENKIDGNHFYIFSIAPGVVDSEMQAHIRNSDEKDFSKRKKFIDLKANNELSSPAEVAEKYFYVLNNLNNFNEPLLDVRNIDL